MSFCLQEDKAELEQQNYITVLIDMFKYTYILLQKLIVYKTLKHTPISHVHAQKYSKEGVKYMVLLIMFYSNTIFVDLY